MTKGCWFIRDQHSAMAEEFVELHGYEIGSCDEQNHVQESRMSEQHRCMQYCAEVVEAAKQP